ncbi:MAG: DNA polymerase III subunit gamma/tau [Acidimicrobiia bacterium]
MTQPHQALYRRYRPRRFSEMRGQEHVVRALRNAVREGRTSHAYFFCGPRGTGKTSAARILAKALNCENPVDGEPCCECASCLAVEAGNSFDVHEHDAASNRGINEMRAILDTVYLGTPGRTKVYILDEVHMLTREAEGALLKTLEEPPPHVKFVLATTDPQKVNETIRSRCQVLNFHLLPAEELAEHVRYVIADAGLEVTDDAIEAVLRQGGGSARDTLSALDQVVAAGGVVGDDVPLDEMIEALIERDAGRAVAAVAVATAAGLDARPLAERLVRQLRDLFLSLMAPELVQLPERTAERVAEQARRLGPAATVRALELLGTMLVELRHAPDPRLLLDVTLVRLASPEADTSVGALLERIERLERGGHTSQSPASASTSAASTPPGAATSAPEAPRGRAVLGSRARAAAPPPSERPVPRAAERPAPAPPAAEPTPEPTAAPAAAPSAATTAGGPLDVAMVGRAWSEKAHPTLRGLAKPLYAAAKLIAVEGDTVTFGTENEVTRDKCNEHRGAAEKALGEALGRKVTIRLVLDRGDSAVGGGGSNSAPVHDEPEHVDVRDLVDAPKQTMRNIVDHLTEAFPGAELIEEES